MSFAANGADKVPFIYKSLHSLESPVYIKLKFWKLFFFFIAIDRRLVNNWTVNLFVVNYFENIVLPIRGNGVTDFTVI